jgi:hypothetical protein
MGKLKYEKYIITDAEPNDPHLNFMRTRLLLSGDSVIPGSLAVNCVWYWKGSDTITTQAHIHNCDEILAFIGTNADNPPDLAGEVEIWLDDERYLLTESCLVFAPKGLVHCPLIIRRADRPIFHFTAKVRAGAHLVG